MQRGDDRRRRGELRGSLRCRQVLPNPKEHLRTKWRKLCEPAVPSGRARPRLRGARKDEEILQKVDERLSLLRHQRSGLDAGDVDDYAVFASLDDGLDGRRK